MSGWTLSIRISKSGFLFFIDRKFILIIFNGRLHLNCFGLLLGFVFVAVGLFNTGLWIGEELAREENEFCEIKEHEVSLNMNWTD